MASPQLKHTWTKSVKNDSGSTVMGDTTVIIGSDEKNFAVAVDPGVTAELDLAVNKDNIISFYLISPAAVTVNTNAADASGGQSIALSAKKGYGWNNTEPTTNPITTTITKFYIINSGSVTTTVSGGFLLSELA